MNNFKDKLNDFFFLDEEDNAREEIIENSPVQEEQFAAEENEKPRKKETVRKKPREENVVAINQKSAMQKPQITIVEPRLYSEVHEVADYLLSNQSVIINFRRMESEQATKVIDFLMGITYAIKGDIQRLGEEIFICTPQSVTVNGSDLTEFKESI